MKIRLAPILVLGSLVLSAPALAAGGQETAAPAPKAPAAQKTPPPQKASPPKPEATGLEKLSSDWPKWLKVGAQYRGRVESVRPVVGNAADYDGYYLNRLRLSVAASLGGWVQVVSQIQDVEAMGYLTSPAPKSMAGGFDLRQGYVEVGRKGRRGVLLTGGRSELTFGDGRLIASPDWGNSSRTYDLGKVSGFLPGVKVDVFRAAPVEIDPARFDRAKPGEYFWGGYASFDKLPGVSLVDVYVLDKLTSVATAERGGKGDGRVYTYGGRVVTTLVKTWTVDADVAMQRGHQASDDVSAWAAHLSVARPLGKSSWKPKATVEYNFASGDTNAKDGKRGTFDQMYASNHGKYGLADLIAWRNMQAVTARLDVSPTKKLKVNVALSRLALANVNDAWYASSGSKTLTNARATSRDIGWEPDGFASYALSKELSMGAGLAVLLPGGYVDQSTKLDRYWYPYVMWALKF